MALVEVGRLHARYRSVDPETAAQFDRVLHRVATEDLAAQLLDLQLPDAYAVCLRELDLAVALDPTTSIADLARAWAAAIADVLDTHLTGPDRGVVVYRHESDLVADVIRSVAAADTTRTWAWHQTGVVDRHVDRPGPAEIAGLLGRRPEIVPAVLRATRSVVGATLDADGWRAVARSVRSAFGPLAPVERSTESGGAAAPTPVVVAVDPGRRWGIGRGPAGPAWPAADLIGAARAIVPAEVWATSGPEERRDLAVLALTCVAPAWSRDGIAIAAVADPAPARVVPPPAEEAAKTAARSSGGAVVAPPPTAAPAPTAAATGPDPEPGPEPEPAGARGHVSEPGAPGDPVVSDVGGVLLLITVIAQLDLPTRVLAGPLAARPPGDALARIVAAATGVPVDDPATRIVAGHRLDEPVEAILHPLVGDAAAAVDQLGRELEAGARTRLQDEGGDLAWAWHRRAVIDARPGWIEATFPLESVDLRLRVAGFDLDPGYVWWLGSIVRFRYV